MSFLGTEMARVVETLPGTNMSLEPHSKNKVQILVVQGEPANRDISLQYDLYFGMKFMIIISPRNNT